MPLGYFTDSTPLTPLRDPFNVLVDGVNAVETAVGDLEDRRAIQTFRWADAAERGAQTGMVAGDVGYQIDTAVWYRYTGSSWAGMPGLIASGTLSAVSSFNIDNLTGYSEYEIILDLPTSSAANTLAAQLRSGGSSDSSSNYDMQRDTGADSATAAAGTYGANSWAALTVSDRTDKFIRLRVNGLNEARRTMAQVEVNAFNATNNGISNRMALRHRTASAFNGIGFTASSGTVSGSYFVYGR